MLKQISTEELEKAYELERNSSSRIVLNRHTMECQLAENIFLQMCVSQSRAQCDGSSQQTSWEIYYFTDEFPEEEQLLGLSLFYQQIVVQRDGEGTMVSAQVWGLTETGICVFDQLLEQKRIHSIVLQYFYPKDKCAHEQEGFPIYEFTPQVEAKHFDFSGKFFAQLGQMRQWKNQNVHLILFRHHLLQFADSDVLLNFLASQCEKVVIQDIGAGDDRCCYVVHCCKNKQAKK